MNTFSTFFFFFWFKKIFSYAQYTIQNSQERNQGLFPENRVVTTKRQNNVQHLAPDLQMTDFLVRKLRHTFQQQQQNEDTNNKATNGNTKGTALTVSWGLRRNVSKGKQGLKDPSMTANSQCFICSGPGVWGGRESRNPYLQSLALNFFPKDKER